MVPTTPGRRSLSSKAQQCWSDCRGGAAVMKAGDRPDFVGLVYIAAFAPDAGESLLAARFG
jgi:hypothetical protein